MITTTDAQVLETLKQVVSERPEYVYSAPEYMVGEMTASCFYVHVDEQGQAVSAGCGVGALLHRIGVPLEELREHEGKTANQILPHVLTGVSRKTAHMLRTFQFLQDEREPWGEAYAEATGETI